MKRFSFLKKKCGELRTKFCRVSSFEHQSPPLHVSLIYSYMLFRGLFLEQIFPASVLPFMNVALVRATLIFVYSLSPSQKRPLSRVFSLWKPNQVAEVFLWRQRHRLHLLPPYSSFTPPHRHGYHLFPAFISSPLNLPPPLSPSPLPLCYEQRFYYMRNTRLMR